MDLKSGKLFWPDQTRVPSNYTELVGDVKCDVAVLGGGLTGALIAHGLLDAGVDVAMVDKRRIGCGSTSASTALVSYEIDVPLCRLTRMRGKPSAVRSYHLCRDAIYLLAGIVQTLKEDCGFVPRQSLLLASARKDVALLRQEWRARQAAGFDVEFLDAGALRNGFNLEAPAALLSADAAQVDPFRLARSLVQAGSDRGLRVFDGTEIQGWTRDRSGVRLKTAKGATIVARWLVVAAGFESQKYLRRKLVSLKSTYAIVTQPLHDPRLGDLPLIWETARPYHYLRTTVDGRIMVGGEDEDFSSPAQRDRLIPAKSKRLKAYLKTMFPGYGIVPEYRWAGTFGETKDGLPYIGAENGTPNVIHALAYGANGTNFAVLAQQLVRDRIMGRKNRDARLFSLNR